MEEGADSYISKPFNKQHLLIRIRKLLEQRSKVREHYKNHLDFINEEENINRLDKEFLAKITNIVEENLNPDQLSVEELSEKMGLSRVSFIPKSEEVDRYVCKRICKLCKTKKIVGFTR